MERFLQNTSDVFRRIKITQFVLRSAASVRLSAHHRSNCATYLHPRAANSPAHHRLQSLIWIQLMQLQTQQDKLACPRARRVQIDTALLLLKHICQMEASPAARDRCWWSKLFTGDLRRLNRAPPPPPRDGGEGPKLAEKSELF